jgi:hypothetical protein
MALAEARLLPGRDVHQTLAHADPVAHVKGNPHLHVDASDDAHGQPQRVLDVVVDVGSGLASAGGPGPAERHDECRHEGPGRRQHARIALRLRVRIVEVEGIPILQRLAPVADEILVHVQRRRLGHRFHGQLPKLALGVFGEVVGDEIQRGVFGHRICLAPCRRLAALARHAGRRAEDRTNGPTVSRRGTACVVPEVPERGEHGPGPVEAAAEQGAGPFRPGADSRLSRPIRFIAALARPHRSLPRLALRRAHS